MAFFENRAVNLLAVHYALHQAAIAGGGAFWLVYLVKSGVSVPTALLSVALVLLGRFLIRPLLVPLGVAYGLRPLLIVGSLATALQYPIIAEVQGVGAMLLLLIVVSAIGDTIYWTSYHAYFAAVGDDTSRGRHIGLREAIGALVGVASPLMAGMLLHVAGPRVAFGITAGVAAASALPLWWAPDVVVRPAITGVAASARRSIVLFAADGWMAVSLHFVWPLALFQVLGESYLAFGATLAGASVVAAIIGPMLGRVVDGGAGRLAVWLGAAVVMTVLVARALSTGSPGFAIAATTLSALVGATYQPALMTAVYTDAKHSPCALRFHVATEGGWDAGGTAGLLASAALLTMGMSIVTCLLLGLAGLVLHLAALLPYYKAQTASCARH